MTSHRLTRAERNQRVLDSGEKLDGLGRRALNGGVITSSAHVVRIIISIGQSAILARLLGPEDFGLIAMALTVTAFVTMFTDMGLSTATVRRSYISQPLVSTLLALNIMVGFGLMILTALMAPVAGLVFSDDRVTIVILCLALSIPISALGAQHRALLARGMRWIPIQLGSLIGQVVGLIVAVVLILYADAGYWALVAQALITPLTVTVFYWIICDWRPSLVYDIRSVMSDIKLGVGLTGFSLTHYFHRQVDNGLIGWYWGAKELGFYNRGYNLFATFQTFCSMPVNSVLMPLLSRSRDRPDYWRRNVLDAAALVYLTNGLIGTLFTCLSAAIVHILLGPAWTHSIDILFYLAPTILISGDAVLNAICTARGDMRALLKSAVLNVSCYVIGFVIALPYGAAAVGASYSIMTLLTLPVMIHIVLRKDIVSVREYYRVTVPFILCGVTVIAFYMKLVPDPFGKADIMTVIIRAVLLAIAYLSLVLIVLRVNPDYTELRKRVSGHLSEVWHSRLVHYVPWSK